PIKLYKPKPGVVGTPIKILKSGENHDDIKEKIDDFCTKTQSATGSGNASSGVGGSNSDPSLYDPWKCYQIGELTKDGQDGVEDVDDEVYDKEVKDAGGLCILENKNKKNLEDPEQFQKTFNDFFYYWVVHMLKDSIYWRTKKIKKCLENGTKTRCNKKNKCKDDCGCFKKWVEKKKTEWKNIKTHFNTQEDIGKETQTDPIVTLEYVLKLQFLNEDTEEKSENSLDAEEAEELKHLQKILKLDEKNTEELGHAKEQKTLMDKLIEHEAQEAEKCKKCEDPPQNPSSVARNENTDDNDRPGVVNNHLSGHGSDSDESGDEAGEEEEEEEKESGDSGTEDVNTSQETTTTEKSVDVCNTVDNILTKDNNALKEACSLKYGPGGKEKFPNWKCVPSGDKAATGSEGSESAGPSRSKRGAEPTRDSAVTTTKSGDTGGFCIPPRRRKLYVGKLHDWASDEATEAESQETSGTSSQSGEKLRDAFIQTAAIETFFLWDRYKKLNTKNKGETQGGGNGEDEDKDPQSKLQQTGEIPNDFLRQMFYTLGDYRDICTGDEKVIQMLKANGDKNIEKIEDKIKIVIENSGSKPSRAPPVPQNSGKDRKTWWDENAKHIWEGMVCALTYKENGSGGEKKIEKDDDVYKKFFGSTPDKPANQNGTFKDKYNYNTVKLDENS
ncbi:hypothetical protein PFFCH_05312, partial [Plasmodium falciparum FCH/4]